jgi:ATP-binding cassette subfamily F protein 3
VLVQLQGVSKSFGSRDLLEAVSFQINPGEKIGLIGPNGCGKTTLLKLVSLLIEPDSGAVLRRSNLRVGSLDQIPDFREGTVLDQALQSFDSLIALETQMRDFERAISSGAGHDALERYSLLQHEYEVGGGYTYRAQTEAVLNGVGFQKAKLTQPSASLSGGEKNRLALAKLMLSNADLLLLDEPTNHLDVRSIEWLEKFLKDTPKTLLVVSHDRVFLDRVVGRIFEIERGRLNDYRGNYSDYTAERARRIAQQEKAWAEQQQWIAREEEYIRRNLAGQKTKQAQSRRTLLARVKRIEKPASASARVAFRFVPADRGRRHVVGARGLAVGYEKPLVTALNLNVERGERWAILGGNGSGKTTLLRTIIGAVSPLDGELEWSEALDFGYYDQQLGDLDSRNDVIDEIRALDGAATDGELRSYLGQFLFSGDDVFKKVGALSGGEKSRLALAKIIYETPQLLVLDEPTNHLDIASCEALEAALSEYPGTILFVTHDRYLARRIATRLLYLENGRAYDFDRLSAFEDWLNGVSDSVEAPASRSAAAPAPKPAEGSGRSKNRVRQLQDEAARLESEIAATEKELAELEASFQNPSAEMDWERAHRRHAELEAARDALYGSLAACWDQLQA